MKLEGLHILLTYQCTYECEHCFVWGSPWQKGTLKEICEKYIAHTHPICGPLLEGGPAAMLTDYNLPHASGYADACHLCYEARTILREHFPQNLNPDQIYGVMK